MHSALFRILVVDDSRAMRILLKNIIDRNDITPYVLEAEDGQAAIKKYKKFKPDLVLLDIQMPGINGLEILKLMKKINPKPAIVILSTSHSKYDTEDARRLGAADYVYKPFDYNDLALRIVKILREKATCDMLDEFKRFENLMKEKTKHERETALRNSSLLDRYQKL